MAEQVTQYHLFDVVGLELEYMIVDMTTLQVCPITDKVLYSLAGEYLTEVDCGRISYSNELALHVIELKTTNPERSLHGLDILFQEHVDRINELLKPHHAKLLPTACHPWMDPFSEMKLWPHEHNPIYEAYNRIFDCRGHGWANLQSAHINLPFCGDEEFAQLHAAIRVLLPIMPALAASSPILEGQVTDKMDKRLDVYRHNQKRVFEITKDVIPEAVFSQKEYEEHILQPMYRAMRSHDPEAILQYEWLNSRGAIARFDRNTIEIRVLDIQECPKADVAIAQAIVWVLKQLIAQKWTPLSTWDHFPTEELASVFTACVEKADETLIEDEAYLRIFDLKKPLRAKDLWRYLLTDFLTAEDNEVLDVILREGVLARRILRSYGDGSRSGILHEIFEKLSNCLKDGVLF